MSAASANSLAIYESSDVALSLSCVWEGTGAVDSLQLSDSSVPDGRGAMLRVVEAQGSVRLLPVYAEFGQIIRHADPGANELAGHLRTRSSIFNPLWMRVFGQTYIRIQRWTIDPGVITFGGTTAHTQLAQYPDGAYVKAAPMPLGSGLLATRRDLVQLTLTEPSPPRPYHEWADEQRRIASEHYLAQHGAECRPAYLDSEAAS